MSTCSIAKNENPRFYILLLYHAASPLVNRRGDELMQCMKKFPEELKN